MDREAIEAMDRELLEAFEENALEERAQASYDMVVSVLAQPKEKKNKNKKDGKRKVDTGNIPGRVTRSKVVDPASHTRSKSKVVDPASHTRSGGREAEDDGEFRKLIGDGISIPR
jgi:hypothetical protein